MKRFQQSNQEAMLLGISLYRRYRPQRFSEVAGQSAAVDVIVKSLERSRIGHAYLFSGPRGCGKTTVARLLAKALNCLAPLNGYEPCCECKNCSAIAAGESLDVIEIDGASNNSVDEVRELKSHVTLAPFASQYKIYIIDEVHMLSISAFNALLKTLEEPPAYVVFVLATTEAHKVPVTIRSRCQHIPFHRIGTKAIFDHLTEICTSEAVAASTDSLWEIARQADGALRDALSMLEQVINLGREEIGLSDIEATLGQGSRTSLERWISGWHRGDMETFLDLERMLAGGASPQRFLEELFSLARNLWLVAKWKNIAETLDISEQEKDYLQAEAPLWEIAKLESLMRFISGLLPQARMGLRTDVLCGLLMAKMAGLDDGDVPVVQTSLQATAPSRVSIPDAPRKPEKKPPVRQAPEKEISSDKQEDTGNDEQEPVSTLTAADSSVSPAWEMLPETLWDQNIWAQIKEHLHDNEFLLFCALMDALPYMESGKLLIDVAYRYCYEFLRLDRNRAVLKTILAQYCEGTETILHYQSLWISCDTQSAPAAPSSKAAGRRSSKTKNADFSSPDFLLETESVEESPTEEVRPGGGVPFDGLVREVNRWIRGDVILIRRSGEEEDPGDEIPGEE